MVFCIAHPRTKYTRAYKHTNMYKHTYIDVNNFIPVQMEYLVNMYVPVLNTHSYMSPYTSTKHNTKQPSIPNPVPNFTNPLDLPR